MRNDYTKNIKLALLACITLFSTQAIAADPSNQDGASPEATVSGSAATPASPDSGNKEVVPATPVESDSPTHKVKGLPYYAKVGKMYVTWIDYNSEYASEASKKFYHGKPSEAAVAAFQRKIGDVLVTNALLVQEAKRRKLKPDNEFVQQQLDQFERRFANDPKWPESRPRVMPIMAARYQNESLRKKLEERVREVHAPNVKQLRQYYAAHPEKFTSPPQQRVSTILLRMDPGAPDSDWQKATEEGQDLVKRLRGGEDFAELAHQYSGDVTAEDGGDMGYLHAGMLPGLPEETVSKLQPGEVSEPITLMEGVAIFRLTERKPPEINSFEAVKPRATELWHTEQSDNAWNNLLAKLKKKTHIEIDESRFLPLAAVIEKPVAEKPVEKPVDEKTGENIGASKPASN